MALDLSLLVHDDTTTPTASTAVAPRASLSEFEEDPGNPRFEEDVAALDQLVEDIRARGILQPIIVRPMESGKLRIRFGARRYRAACRLGLADIPYLVTVDERQFDDFAQVAENERRHGLQPLELATFIAKKLAAGDSKRSLAKKLQVDPSAITHLLALTGDVPPLVMELYHSGRCRTPQYLYQIRKLHEQAPALVQQRCSGGDVVGRPFLLRLAEEVAQTLAEKDSGAQGGESPPVAATMPATAEAGSLEKNGDATDSRPQPRKPAGDARFRPQLWGTVAGLPVLVDLTSPPSAPDRLPVRDADGLLREVAIGDIVLTALRHAT